MSTATASPPTERVTLTTDLTKSTQARAIPGAYYDRGDGVRGWYINPNETTPRAAAVALKLFPELTFTAPQLVALRDQLIQDVRPFDNATSFDAPIGAPRIRAKLEERGHDLYRFQELDLGYLTAVLEKHGAAYLGWERGLGKTIGALSLVDETDARSVLVVAPNTAKAVVWLPECEHYLDWFDHVVMLPNVKARRERVLGWVRDWKAQGHSVCLIVHYEALALIGDERRAWERYGEWDIVLADEAHRIKNPKAKMTRALKKVPARHKVALSGSIIMNHVEELFSPLQWLFPDMYRSKWRDWNDRFIDYVEGGWAKLAIGIKIERLEELREELGVFMVYRRKEDELDLPERTEQTLKLELTPGQRKAYEQLQNECMAELEDESTMFAMSGLPMLVKLRQVATGLDLVSDEIQDSAKLDMAMELIEDNADEAFVVFSWFRSAARSMAERLEAKGIECFCVDGDVKHDDRADMVKRFQAGERRVFVGTIATMGESVNLFRANNAIFLDISWNPGDNAQAADRIYRIGQDKPVTITYLVAKDTVDEHRVLPTVMTKEALRRMILGG